MPEQRIISLLPAATEMLAAVGALPQLVGRSHVCDFPPEIQDLPVCSSARQEHGRWIIELREPEILRLKPTAIISQDTCAVCAISEHQVRDFAKHHRLQIQVLALKAHRLAEIWDDIRAVANLSGKIDAGKELLSSLKNRVVDVLEKTVMMKKRPTVACIEWFEPLMYAGHWVPELVEMAGGKNVFGATGEPSLVITFDQLKTANPDYILLMPCGFSLSETVTHAQRLQQQPGWRDLRAVRNNQVFAYDGNQLFNRPGPRIVDSLQLLTETLHPGLITLSDLRHLVQRL